MESQSQAVRGDVERYGRYTLSVRKGSGGELNTAFSLLFLPFPYRGRTKQPRCMDDSLFSSLRFNHGAY